MAFKGQKRDPMISPDPDDYREDSDGILDELQSIMHERGLEEERILEDYHARLHELGDKRKADSLRQVIDELRNSGRVGIHGHLYVTQRIRSILHRNSDNG